MSRIALVAAAGNDLWAATVVLDGRSLLSGLALLGAVVAFAVFGVLARVLSAALAMIMTVLGAATKAAVSIPVFTSSLMLVPLVQRMLPPGRAVGVLTVDAASLQREHLAGAGISPDTPLVIAGLETEKEFTRVLLDDLLSLAQGQGRL